MRSLRPSSWTGGRAEATTTCRPPSSSELMMCSNSCSVFSPRMNSRSSISRMSIGAELVLEGHRVLALDGLDELVAEALGRQIEHVGLGRAPLHLPGDGVLEMRLAEPDAGVEVERIEAALLGEHGLGDLDRGGMRHAVGRADDEAVEGVARIERRALEAVDVRAPHHGARSGGCTCTRRASVVTGSASRHRPCCAPTPAPAWRSDGRPLAKPGWRRATSTRSTPVNSAAQHCSRSSE